MSEHTIETPTDLDINKQKDIHLDSANDLATTSGVAQIEQSVGLDVLDITQDFVGEHFNGEQIGRLEDGIRRSLQQDEQVLTVRQVEISAYNPSTGKVEVDIFTVDDPDFTIEVML